VGDVSEFDVLLEERRRLLARLEEEREQLEIVEKLTGNLNERIAGDERLLSDIESALGKNPQLQLADSDLRLRGRRLEAVAIELLAKERGDDAEVHYREWFELLRSHGHLVAGKKPIDTFLAQLGRSENVERMGRRTGLYRLRQSAA
jgi:hypothetical protein